MRRPGKKGYRNEEVQHINRVSSSFDITSQEVTKCTRMSLTNKISKAKVIWASNLFIRRLVRLEN